jgi:hypothetical protein
LYCKAGGVRPLQREVHFKCLVGDFGCCATAEKKANDTKEIIKFFIFGMRLSNDIFGEISVCCLILLKTKATMGNFVCCYIP